VKVEVYPLNAPDLNTYVGNLRKAGIDGMIAWIASVPAAAMAFNAMNAQKWYPPITGHNGLFLDALFDLVPAEALTNVYGTMYRSLMWTDTTSPGPRQVAFAKKVAAFYPEGKGSGVPVANSPYYDFLHVLKVAIEGEKSFETGEGQTRPRQHQGLPGAVGHHQLHAGEPHRDRHRRHRARFVASGKDPKAMGIFPRNGQVGMDLDLLVGALTAGSLYALVAMGFNILYRPTNVFNFAQGDLVMLGAMFGATFITLLGLPWFVGAALAMLAVAALALIEEKIAVAPVLSRSATGHSW